MKRMFILLLSIIVSSLVYAKMHSDLFMAYNNTDHDIIRIDTNKNLQTNVAITQYCMRLKLNQ